MRGVAARGGGCRARAHLARGVPEPADRVPAPRVDRDGAHPHGRGRQGGLQLSHCADDLARCGVSTDECDGLVDLVRSVGGVEVCVFSEGAGRRARPRQPAVEVGRRHLGRRGRRSTAAAMRRRPASRSKAPSKTRSTPCCRSSRRSCAAKPRRRRRRTRCVGSTFARHAIAATNHIV